MPRRITTPPQSQAAHILQVAGNSESSLGTCTMFRIVLSSLTLRTVILSVLSRRKYSRYCVTSYVCAFHIFALSCLDPIVRSVLELLSESCKESCAASDNRTLNLRERRALELMRLQVFSRRIESQAGTPYLTHGRAPLYKICNRSKEAMTEGNKAKHVYPSRSQMN